MVYKGHIEKGCIVLEDAVDLPEGAAVFVQLISAASAGSLHPDIVRFTGIIPQDIDIRSEYCEAMQAKHA